MWLFVYSCVLEIPKVAQLIGSCLHSLDDILCIIVVCFGVVGDRLDTM